MKDIIVIGGGGHAKVVISIIKKLKAYNIIGYTDIVNRGNILGVCYIGTDEEVLSYSKQLSLALGIGQIRNLEFRKKIVNKFIDRNHQFLTLISPHAIVNEEVLVGKGTVIMDGVVLQPGVKIGEYSIVNTGSRVDHDCEIGDFVHIAPGSTICGEVIVKNSTFIGAGSTIVNGVEIIANQFIKAHTLCK